MLSWLERRAVKSWRMRHMIACGGAETVIPRSTTFSGHCCGLRGNPLDLSNLGIQILAKAKIDVAAGRGDLHAEAIKELDNPGDRWKTPELMSDCERNHDCQR